MRVQQIQTLIKVHGIQACKVALLVGSVLIVINQFNALFGDEPFRWLPAVLTYLVPFCVFLWGRSKSG